MRKKVAEVLRGIARQFERGTSPVMFSCNGVFLQAGPNVREDYADTFDLDNEEITGELWISPDCESIRVLMLCFAAAMAETGDL